MVFTKITKHYANKLEELYLNWMLESENYVISEQ